jgi:hypothetical protein
MSQEPKIYNSPGVGDLRRVDHPDGVSFMTYFLERHEDENPISVGVDLSVANDKGNVSLTMRRVAAKPEGMECTTTAIRLTPEAARDLIEVLSKVI